jgi:hypothetical protein
LAYDQSGWSPFAGALGAIAGALTGLLFVGVSLTSDVLIGPVSATHTLVNVCTMDAPPG